MDNGCGYERVLWLGAKIFFNGSQKTKSPVQDLKMAFYRFHGATPKGVLEINRIQATSLYWHWFMRIKAWMGTNRLVDIRFLSPERYRLKVSAYKLHYSKF